MAHRLMKQSAEYIHQAGAELMYVDRQTDKAESSLLHHFVTNKLRQAATQPLKTTVFWDVIPCILVDPYQNSRHGDSWSLQNVGV